MGDMAGSHFEGLARIAGWWWGGGGGVVQSNCFAIEGRTIGIM